MIVHILVLFLILENDIKIKLLNVDEIFKLPYPELESFITRIYQILSGSNNNDKITMLKYITIQCETYNYYNLRPKFANIISSSAIITVLLELLQEYYFFYYLDHLLNFNY